MTDHSFSDIGTSFASISSYMLATHGHRLLTPEQAFAITEKLNLITAGLKPSDTTWIYAPRNDDGLDLTLGVVIDGRFIRKYHGLNHFQAAALMQAIEKDPAGKDHPDCHRLGVSFGRRHYSGNMDYYFYVGVHPGRFLLNMNLQDVGTPLIASVAKQWYETQPVLFGNHQAHLPVPLARVGEKAEFYAFDANR